MQGSSPDPILRRSETARRNGGLSRGPATPEGKAHPTMNVTHHGVRARTMVLGAGEDGLAALRAAMLMRWQPVDAAEAQLVQVLALARDVAESSTNEPAAADGGASENYTNEFAPCTDEPERQHPRPHVRPDTNEPTPPPGDRAWRNCTNEFLVRHERTQRALTKRTRSPGMHKRIAAAHERTCRPRPKPPTGEPVRRPRQRPAVRRHRGSSSPPGARPARWRPGTSGRRCPA